MTRKRRIALIVPEYPPNNIGGGGHAFKALGEALSIAGHSVTVVAGDHTGAGGFYKEGRLTLVRVPLIRTPSSTPYLRGYLPPAMTRLLWAAVQECAGCDTFHVHGCGLPFSDIAGNLLSLLGRNYFLTNHGYPHRPSRNTISRILFNVYGTIVVRRSVLRATAVSAVSDYCRMDGPLTERPVDVIPNGIDPWWQELELPAVEARDQRTLLFVGRLQHDKGLHVLLEAIVRARGRWTLRVVGQDGGEFSKLQEKIRELRLESRVSFLGSRDREGVRREMRSAYATVMPSLNEPYGLVGLEAMATGSLLICSDSGGLREYANSQNALMFKTGDPESLRIILDGLPMPPHLYMELAEAGRCTARARSWEKVADQYMRWYSA